MVVHGARPRRGRASWRDRGGAARRRPDRAARPSRPRRPGSSARRWPRCRAASPEENAERLKALLMGHGTAGRAARGGAQRRRPAADRGQGGDAERGRRAGARRRSARARAYRALKALRRDQQWLNRRRARRDRRAQARRRRRAARRRQPRRAARPGGADAAQPRAPRSPGPGARFIMEVKKASPSAGAIAGGRRSGGAGARPMPAPPTRSACSPTGPISAARSTIWRAVRRRLRRADPRQGFHRRSAPGGRGAARTAPTRCWSCCRCSTMTRRAGGDGGGRAARHGRAGRGA